jgi:hypothetical protein
MMNKITVTDNRTGEVLNIEYDAGLRKYSINGINVIRQQPLESSEDEFVFSPSGSGAQKLYNVLSEEIKRLSKP